MDQSAKWWAGPFYGPGLLIFGFLLHISLTAHGQVPHSEFKAGSIIDTVTCLEDPHQSYALYLPSQNPMPNSLMPILYIFDPAARGRHGVAVFREAAERLGFILVCSNNSRNGSWDLVFDAADALFADTEKRLQFDPARRYTAGFSGGSRAALALGVLAEGKIRGVIGCGAGYPPVVEYHPDASDDFFYIGLVGHRDMNFCEQQNTKKSLDDLTISNRLIYFDGIHQWPPKNAIALALLELQLQHTQTPKNTWMAAYLRGLYENAQTMYQLGFANYAVEILTNFPSGVPSSRKLENFRREIESETNLKKEARINQKIKEREVILINRYLSAFRQVYRTPPNGAFDLQWWKDEIISMQELKAESKDRKWQYLGWRMLNLISARSAESAFRYEQEENFRTASALLNIWAFADPLSAQPYWYRAKMAAGQGKQALAIEQLENAVKNGLKSARALDHPAFLSLRDSMSFQKLRDRIQSSSSGTRN